METAAPVPLHLLPPPRRRILELLKGRPGTPAEEVARRLGITVSGARQHLTALEADGLVAHRAVRQGPGRPRHLFALTPGGDALFPRRHGELARELLGYIHDESPELLERLFARRARRRLEEARDRLGGLDLAARVRELARILDQDGYLARVEPRDGGGFLLVEGNCAVLAVAERYGHACSSEIDFFREALPDAEIRRVFHIVRGDAVCAYEIVPREPTTA